MKLLITSALLDEIRAHAVSTPDLEVCGLLLGHDLCVEAVLPATNVAACPAAFFEIDPAVLIAVHKATRAGGPALIGCYHSHPNGRAEPSPRDAAQAEEGAVWVIAADGQLSAWRFSQGKFRRCAILPS